MKDLVSMIITAEQKATIIAALKQIEACLQNMVSLSPDERKSAIGMRAKNGDFARGTLRIAAQGGDACLRRIDGGWNGNGAGWKGQRCVFGRHRWGLEGHR